MDSVAIGNEAASSNNDNNQSSSTSPSEIGPEILFKAAADGDIEPFKESVEQLDLIVTPIENTVLHINIISENVLTQFVEEILEIFPPLLLQVNAQGDTPLHVAVKLERGDVVKALIKRAREQYNQDVENGIRAVRQMLRKTNKKGNTALHEAMRNHSIDVVETYVQEDPVFPYSANHCGETPLYIAAENAFFSGAVKMLETTSMAHEGPDGKTVLHAAARMNFRDCYDLVDDREWNVLHFAMASMTTNELLIVAKNPLIRRLVHEKDANGNTPLHVFAALDPIPSLFEDVIKEFGGKRNAVNKRYVTVSNIIYYGCPELKEEIRELADANDGPYQLGVIRRNLFPDEKRLKHIQKSQDSKLVVAALIATVSFAAAFTSPGGYQNEEGPDKGTAILSKKSAFQAFVLTNSIAMVLSITSVLLNFWMSLRFQHQKYLFLFRHATMYTMVAMAAMVLAFTTGSYAVMSPSFGLCIVTSLAGFTFFLLLVYIIP